MADISFDFDLKLTNNSARPSVVPSRLIHNEETVFVHYPSPLEYSCAIAFPEKISNCENQ